MTLKARFDSKWTPEPFSGCWLWMAAVFKSWGYGQFAKNTAQTSERAHRISWELYRGEIPAGMHVLHKCDTPSCVNPDHLFLGTHRDNMGDMKAKKRWRIPAFRGERHARATISEETALIIKRSPLAYQEIAKQLGVSPQIARKIKKGIRWTHLK